MECIVHGVAESDTNERLSLHFKCSIKVGFCFVFRLAVCPELGQVLGRKGNKILYLSTEGLLSVWGRWGRIDFINTEL